MVSSWFFSLIRLLSSFFYLFSMLISIFKKSKFSWKTILKAFGLELFRVLASLVTDTTTCRVFSYCADILCFSRIYLISYLRFVIAVPANSTALWRRDTTCVKRSRAPPKIWVLRTSPVVSPALESSKRVDDIMSFWHDFWFLAPERHRAQAT